MPKDQRDTYTVAVGERLAVARKTVVPRMTQAKAAELLSKELKESVTSQSIANYEQGIRLPNPQVGDALCQIYGTATASFVLGLSDAPQSVRELTHLKKYRLADERGKYALDRLAESEQAIVESGQYEGKPESKAG